MLARWNLFSTFKKIASVVALVHVALVLACIVHHFATRRVRVNRPITVRTVAAAQVLAPMVVQSKPAKSVATAVAKPAPAKKSVAKKGIETTAKPVAKAKKEVAPVVKEALAIPSVITAKPLPNVKPLYTKEEVKIEDVTYGAYLVGYLQGLLDLPERGDVKVKLEIDRFGKLIECEVLQTRSEKNAEFLKNRLPELAYPCLNDFDILEATETFTITFCNVEDL